MRSVKAFRGTRRSSIYREFVLEDEAFDRIVAAAGLDSLAGELGKDEARRLAEQLTELRASAALPELDDHLTAIAELAHWCGRATGEAWLRIEPRTGV
jgi:hypothetical protein